MANIFRGSFMNTDHSLEDFQDKKVGSFSIPQNENYHLSENSTSTFFPIENLFPDTIKNMNSSAENEVRNTNRIIGNNDSQFEKEVSEEEIEENADSFSSSSEMDDSELAETQSKIKSASSLENKKEFKPHKRKLKVEDAGEDVEPHSKKKRGRPSGKHPDLKPKIIQKMVGSVANNALSVRSIPCFYRDCSYSYKRPGSTIVEISDRPLVLPKKFGNFTIRSCKKHHDKWKSKSRSLCEVCKGLNCTIPNSLSEIKAYVNANQVTFTLCDFCADRQREMLQLLPGSSEVKPDMLTFEDVDEEESRPEGSEASLPMEMDGQGADVGQHTRPKKFTVYKRTSQPNGWNLVKGVNYISSCIWDVGQVPVQRPNIVYVDKDPPQLSIRKVNDVLGIFADNNIQPGTCLGEFTGRVVERKGKHRRYCLGLTPEWDIDASTHSNEFRFIADSLGVDACCNVKFEIVDNSVLVITTQKLKKNDQLFADFGSSSSEKERQYVEYFNSIQQFNQENLTAEELSNSAFQWFIEEGCKLLHAKAKITVPIEKRHPAKKSIANNYSIKKQNVVKNENEWGYVAQLERLDLERAREDCWVTFKAGKGWNFESFSRAVLVWKKSGNYVEVPNPPKKIMPPTTVSPIVKKEKDNGTKLITKPKKEKYENRVQLLSFLSQEFTASRQLEGTLLKLPLVNTL